MTAPTIKAKSFPACRKAGLSRSCLRAAIRIETIKANTTREKKRLLNMTRLPGKLESVESDQKIDQAGADEIGGAEIEGGRQGIPRPGPGQLDGGEE
jgi:hypothetical protein